MAARLRSPAPTGGQPFRAFRGEPGINDEGPFVPTRAPSEELRGRLGGKRLLPGSARKFRRVPCRSWRTRPSDRPLPQLGCTSGAARATRGPSVGHASSWAAWEGHASMRRPWTSRADVAAPGAEARDSRTELSRSVYRVLRRRRGHRFLRQVGNDPGRLTGERQRTGHRDVRFSHVESARTQRAEHKLRVFPCELSPKRLRGHLRRTRLSRHAAPPQFRYCAAVARAAEPRRTRAEVTRNAAQDLCAPIHRSGTPARVSRYTAKVASQCSPS